MEVLELQSVWEVNVETLLQRLQTVGRWSVEKTDSQTNRGENTLINLN